MNEKVVFEQKPEEFVSEYEAVGCLVEYCGEILLVHRRDEEHLWAIPETKVNNGESPLDAIVRKIKAKTGSNGRDGFDITNFAVKHEGDVYVKNPEHDFEYHIFHINLTARQREEINKGLDANNKEFIWMRPVSARTKLPLVHGLDEYIKLFYS